MIDKIRNEDQLRKQRARQMMKKVHPDKLQHAGMSGQEAKIGESLIPFLDRILKRPEEKGSWGRDLNRQYSRGSEITLVGVSPDNTLRTPRNIILRNPSDFLDILEEYINTGNISDLLLQRPEYDPLTARATSSEYSGEIDEADQDDPDAPWNAPDPVADALEAAQSLKDAIRTAVDFDHCMALRLASRIQSQHNMRMHGVLEMLDKKVEEMITKEISGIDSDEKVKVVEEHIREFDFDDKTIAPRLEKILNEYKLRTGWGEVVYAPPSELEVRASNAPTLDALKEIISEIESKEFDSEQERIRMRKSINTYAKKILSDECNHNASLEAFKRTYDAAQNFPFSDEEYGFNVLDIIEMRAKYFVIGKILNTPSIQSLEAIMPTIDRFPFRHPENAHDLRMTIERHYQIIHKKRAVR